MVETVLILQSIPSAPYSPPSPKAQPSPPLPRTNQAINRPLSHTPDPPTPTSLINNSHTPIRQVLARAAIATIRRLHTLAVRTARNPFLLPFVGVAIFRCITHLGRCRRCCCCCGRGCATTRGATARGTFGDGVVVGGGVADVLGVDGFDAAGGCVTGEKGAAGEGVEEGWEEDEGEGGDDGGFHFGGVFGWGC